MSISTTTELSRSAAEARYVELRAMRRAKKWRAKAEKMSDTEFADEIKRLSGNRFDGYLIRAVP